MGLTVSQRRAVTKAIATRYKRADKAGKGVILDSASPRTGPRCGYEGAATPSPARCSRARSRSAPGRKWDDAAPGFVEIDLVGHEGGNAVGDHCYTVIGVDSGSEFINHLLDWCAQRQITFIRSCPGNSNAGAHVEQKDWAIVRTVVGYHRYDTAAELALLNKIWVLQSLMTNYFYPQQKLISKVRDGAKVIKKYDPAQTPYQRVLARLDVSKKIKTALSRQYRDLNPAQIRRDIRTLNDQLLDPVKAKHQPSRLPVTPPPAPRASAREATKRRSRAS